MSSAAAASPDEPSGFQPPDAPAPEGGGITALLARWLGRAAARSIKIWLKLPRRARILLTGLVMTFCSFGLSMIVSVLTQ